jgi:hypothetical protein
MPRERNKVNILFFRDLQEINELKFHQWISLWNLFPVRREKKICNNRPLIFFMLFALARCPRGKDSREGIGGCG